jgi:hypothetical protein
VIAETRRVKRILREGIKDHIQNTLNFRENLKLYESVQDPKRKFIVKKP